MSGKINITGHSCNHGGKIKILLHYLGWLKDPIKWENKGEVWVLNC